MRIAILGATSVIAKDFILTTASNSGRVGFVTEFPLEVYLFSRRPVETEQFLASYGVSKGHFAADYCDLFDCPPFDVILNFVGAGDPARVNDLGPAIFEVTQHYDDLALRYLKKNPTCRYIFMSSGAVYGDSFDLPVSENSISRFPVNELIPQYRYGLAKFHAECRHRSFADLPIFDVRIFNYFSASVPIDSQFFLSTAVRAIIDRTCLEVDHYNIVRDYIGPVDFCRLLFCLIYSGKQNGAFDCVSLSPVYKFDLLEELRQAFGLSYSVLVTSRIEPPTGFKLNYFSTDRRIEKFGFSSTTTSLDLIRSGVEEILAK